MEVRRDEESLDIQHKSIRTGTQRHDHRECLGWLGRFTEEDTGRAGMRCTLIGKCLRALGLSLWDLNEQSGKVWAVKQWCKVRNCSTCLTVFQKKTSEVWEMGCICVHALWKMAQKTHLGMPLWRGSDDRGHLYNLILESEIEPRASCMLGMCSTTHVHSWLSSELFKTFVNVLLTLKRGNDGKRLL